jgi:hypothetical protein
LTGAIYHPRHRFIRFLIYRYGPCCKIVRSGGAIYVGSGAGRGYRGRSGAAFRAPILADEPPYIIAAQRYLNGNLSAPRPRTAADYLGATPDNFEHPPLVKYLFGVAQWLDGAPHSLSVPRVVSAGR